MSRSRGQVLIWVAALMPSLLGVVGLVGDGGVLFAEHRKLQQVADGAAREGAARLDVAAYRASGAVSLDPRAAEEAARAYVELQDPSLGGTVAADTAQVTVRLREDVPLVFLRAIGITTAPVGASATARPRQTAGSGP